MTAPTEAEIREALRARVERFPADNPGPTSWRMPSPATRRS